MAEAQNSPTESTRAGGPPPLGSTTAGQIAVAAESTVATRMSAPPSFDVADFPIPHGREEEWRFTPLDRLRGLHDGTARADGKVLVEVTAGQGVRVETVGRDDARIRRAGPDSDPLPAAAVPALTPAPNRRGG